MSDRIKLEGSERPRPQGTEDGGAVDDGERVEVTVYVRSDPATSSPVDPAAEAGKPPAERRYLSAQEAAAAYGAADADIQAVRDFAADHGLDVIRVNPAARSVKLGGSAADVADAFGVKFRHYRHGRHRFRGHDGAVQLPAELGGVVTGVFGLDDRRLGSSFVRPAPSTVQAGIEAFLQGGDAAAQPANTYLPPQVAALYDFPTESASAETVAVFAFNGPVGDGTSAPGGYDSSVLDSYFTDQLGLPAPDITTVTVQGPGNDPGDGSNPNDSSPEVYLDLSIVGSLATGAKIVLYFTEFTEQGWVDALTTASTDTTNDPTVISISYGNPEDGTGSAWTSAAVTQVNSAFEQASARGKTITCAAGDNGASDGETSGLHVDFPASSPWVLACGGTRLQTSGTTISSETVWNDQADGNGATGGGVSVVFTPPPTWQTSAGVSAVAGETLSGRGVPDVASLADPETPYIVAQPSGSGGVGGTSAAAPLWASLVALGNASLGTPLGYLNPLLYTLPTGTLRDITSGNNAAPGGQGYDAGPGWDACSGFGAPGGSALVAAVQSSSSTPSP